MTSPPHHQRLSVVTGGAGFIGSHLVERLLAEGRSVAVIDDCSTGSWDNLRAVAEHPRLERIESTVSACDRLRDLCARAESIYHLAAAVGVDLVLKEPVRSLQTNLRETEAILEAAGAHGVPVLVASSSEVYGRSAREVFGEEDDLLIGPPQFARWGYACSKLMDEFMALAWAIERRLPVVIARIFNTVGPRQTGRYGMVLPRFIAAATTGAPIRVFGDGTQTRCFCWVGDAVEALLRLQQTPQARGEVFNVGGSEEVTMRQLADRVVTLLGSASSIELVPYAKAYQPGFEDLPRRRPRLDKLDRVIGFRPETCLDEIIRRTAAGV